MKLRQPHDEAVCSWVKASLLARDRLRRTAAPRSSGRSTRPSGRTARAPRRTARAATCSSVGRPRPDAEAIQDSLAAIDAIETLRSLQDDSDGSAEQFSTWTSDYYWLSGRLLREALSEGDLDLAFSITERMRARSLLDTLERSRTPSGPGTVPPS